MQHKSVQVYLCVGGRGREIILSLRIMFCAFLGAKMCCPSSKTWSAMKVLGYWDVTYSPSRPGSRAHRWVRNKCV